MYFYGQGADGRTARQEPRYTAKHSIPSVEMTVLAGQVENIDLQIRPARTCEDDERVTRGS